MSCGCDSQPPLRCSIPRGRRSWYAPGVPHPLHQEIFDTMGAKMSSAAHLNQGLRIFFSEFVRVSLRHPSQALFFARTVIWQGAAARRRALLARREGLHVPPIAIFSITNGCNLPSKG